MTSDTLDYLKTYARFPFSLHRFLSRSLTLQEAEHIASLRLRQRQINLVNILERSVYGHASSPYRALLKHAGIDLGDVRARLDAVGIEETLRELRAAGVYVTFEEFKGRKPIVRPGLELPVQIRDFDNPYAGPDMTVTTGGSTGMGMYISHSLDHFASASHHQRLMLDAYGMIGAPGVVWLPIFPGTGLTFIMRRVHLRESTRRWFSFLGWRDASQWLKYDVAMWYTLAWLWLFRAGVPKPEIVRHDQALVVARAIRDLLDSEGRCMFYTMVSHAVRVCLAAEQAGFNLEGAAVRLSGEPATPAKVKVLRRVGLRPVPNYGSVETGPMSVACMNPASPDDTHLWSDAFALITHPFHVPDADLVVPAFNLTSLFADSPKIMLNYQTDDYGIVETRTCGCQFEHYGFNTHVREIRSYTKLVGEGVTMIGNEMTHILEDILPARFGGTALDYQLLEQEDTQGFTRLYLLIHPRVEIADEPQVKETFVRAVRESSTMANVAGLIWQQTDTIQIKRQPPILSARGKFSPLHMERNRVTNL